MIFAIGIRRIEMIIDNDVKIPKNYWERSKFPKKIKINIDSTQVRYV